MAEAYKCDRCGKFYENKLKNDQNKSMAIIYGSNISKYDRSADICDDCYEAFMEWWNKPTMNQLNLSKDSPYICTVTGNKYACMGGCGYKSGIQCMDDSEDSPCQYRTLPPSVEELCRDARNCGLY